ncbi:MAG: LPXTG cell wall anchor domain-containing protein [Firmicutes bacterium]|nr:LPXTG cell wall anchor domain-containing protein [Bacillota bacterium]
MAEEVMVIEEPEVPLAEEPEFEEPVEIEEPEVPLAEVPKTGDNMMVWLLAAILSLIGAAITFRRKNEA